MTSLDTFLGRSSSPEEFYASVVRRLAPEAEALNRQARLIATKFPQLKEETIRKADQALQGMLILPGTGAKPHFVGNPPGWFDLSLNDNEYVWGLNRLLHWMPLLQAFSLTGDARYAQKVVDELQDWIKSCPRPPLDNPHNFGKVDPWRSLEVGIRLFTSWPLIIPHLLGSKFLTPALLVEYAGSVFEHCEALYFAPPIFFPRADHNHYIMENLGLLAAATLFPEFATAKKWREFAVQELERCAAAQMTPEGGQIEGCPHYHNGCIGWLVQALSIARAHGVSFSQEYVSKIERGIDYTLHSLRPSGTAVPWGDSDADKEVAIRPVLSGYRLFGNPDYLHIAVNCFGVEVVRSICTATAWENFDLDENLSAIEQAARNPGAISIPAHCWQKTLKQAMLRSDWSHEALSVFFACRTPINNQHAHIDPMGFDFTAYGRALIVDPGRFTYREDSDRRDFKSAAYHNTLTIYGRDPFEYISSWSYGPQKDGTITEVRIEPGRKFAFARHANYEPAIHHRAVVLIESTALLVVDWVENLQPGDLLRLYYHFDSTRVNWDAVNGCAESRDANQANVQVVPSAGFTGKLLTGRVSDFIDAARPSTRLCLTASPSEKTSQAFATAIVPWPASSTRPQVGAPQITPSETGLNCSFQVNDVSHSFDWPQASITR